jgi:hypothetical protein
MLGVGGQEGVAQHCLRSDPEVTVHFAVRVARGGVGGTVYAHLGGGGAREQRVGRGKGGKGLEMIGELACEAVADPAA